MLFLCILLIILFLFETFIVILSFLFNNIPAFLLRDARHAMHDILLLRISAILPEAIYYSSRIFSFNQFCKCIYCINIQKIISSFIPPKSLTVTFAGFIIGITENFQIFSGNSKFTFRRAK